MRTWSRVVAFVLLVAVAFWFAAENGSQVVTVDFGLFRVRSSLPLVVFASILLGMLAVFAAGVKADLETRRTLRRYRAMMGRGEWMEHGEPRGTAAPGERVEPREREERTVG